MDVAALKADLAKAENTLAMAKAQIQQLIGICGYLRGKIAELEKPKDGETDAA